MNTELIETFFAEKIEVFHFLEELYGYQQLNQEINYPDEWRDTTALIKYVSSHVGVQILWGLADGFVGVVFVELLQPGTFPTASSLFPLKDHSDMAKAIALYDLADMLGHSDDPDFLLKGIGNFRTRNRRMKTIEIRMPEVLAGLARATQTYATPILLGDTSIFPRVMKFYVAKQKRLYPYLFLPPDVDDDPS